MTALTNTPTWQKLASLAEDVKQQHMRDWFASDSSRAKKYQQTACGIELDFSKNLHWPAKAKSRKNVMLCSRAILLITPNNVQCCTPLCVIFLASLFMLTVKM